MSPKSPRHGGPTHEGDPPPPPRPFGAALAAARAARELPPADEDTEPEAAQTEQVTATPDTPPVERFAASAQTDADEAPASGSGPPALPPVDDTNREREHPGTGVEMTDVEALAGGSTAALAAGEDAEPAVSTTVGDGIKVVYIADDALPPSVTVTVGAAEPSSFGDVTAEGGSGSGGQATPDATDVHVTTDAEGGEQSSPGTSSSTLPKKPRTSTGGPKQNGRPRARTTGNRSPQVPGENSTADSTATSGRTTAGSDE